MPTAPPMPLTSAKMSAETWAETVLKLTTDLKNRRWREARDRGVAFGYAESLSIRPFWAGEPALLGNLVSSAACGGQESRAKSGDADSGDRVSSWLLSFSRLPFYELLPDSPSRRAGCIEARNGTSRSDPRRVLSCCPR